MLPISFVKALDWFRIERMLRAAILFYSSHDFLSPPFHRKWLQCFPNEQFSYQQSRLFENFFIYFYNILVVPKMDRTKIIWRSFRVRYYGANNMSMYVQWAVVDFAVYDTPPPPIYISDEGDVFYFNFLLRMQRVLFTYINHSRNRTRCTLDVSVICIWYVHIRVFMYVLIMINIDRHLT